MHLSLPIFKIHLYNYLSNYNICLLYHPWYDNQYVKITAYANIIQLLANYLN